MPEWTRLRDASLAHAVLTPIRLKKLLTKKRMNKAPTNNISSIQLLSKDSDLMHRFLLSQLKIH